MAQAQAPAGGAVLSPRRFTPARARLNLVPGDIRIVAPGTSMARVSANVPRSPVRRLRPKLLSSGPRMSDDFQIAYERARERVGEDIWLRMSSRDQVDAIYRELRALDAERAATPPGESGDKPEGEDG
jgi:hypothetical protein